MKSHVILMKRRRKQQYTFLYYLDQLSVSLSLSLYLTANMYRCKDGELMYDPLYLFLQLRMKNDLRNWNPDKKKHVLFSVIDQSGIISATIKEKKGFSICLL